MPAATASGHAIPASYAPAVNTNPETASLLQQIAATMASKTEITNELNKRLLEQAAKSESINGRDETDVEGAFILMS